MNKFFTLFALAIMSLLFTNCGKVEEINPQTAIINKWTIDKFIVKTSTDTYSVPLSASTKYIDIDMFTIDTDQISFKADSNLTYLDNSTMKNGKWFLSQDKKQITMLDEYETKYNSKIVFEDGYVTFFGESFDPASRNLTYAQNSMYYDINTALESIDVYSTNGTRFLQLGVRYKKN